MAITPENVVRHELIGLRAAVVDAADGSQIGIAGDIVGETTRTLRLQGADRVWTVPKATATFAIDLPDGETVTVDGERLLARPARRTEQQGDSRWH